jgi:shikimate dehydrogenase
LRVVDFTTVGSQLLQQYRDPLWKPPSRSSHGELPDGIELRPYQEQAIKAWSAAGGRGIFAMATGSGKTLTALSLAYRIAAKNRPLMVVVICPFLNLCEQWIGENTDGKGFLLSLQDLIDPKGKHIVVFGAGGASRAICVELALAGAAKLTVVNRSSERGEELAELLKRETSAEIELVDWKGDYTLPATSDVVVNATSIGLAPDLEARLALDVNTLQPHMVVADVIPNPPQTRLLKDAAARGCRTLDGLGMLVNQGATNMEYWTGVAPDKAVMRKTLEEIFGV